MHGIRGSRHLPQLASPSNRSMPGSFSRVVPVRSPPPVKPPPPPPTHTKALVPLPARPSSVCIPEYRNRQRMKNTYICTGVCFGCFFFVLILILSLSSDQFLDENCPDHNLTLTNWNPGQNPRLAMVVQNGQRFKLTVSATIHSLTIRSGGLVVFADNKDGSNNITLRTRFILIEEGGALHIGGPKCRYRSHASITLVGRSDDGSVSPIPKFGRKFVGVHPGGTLELHGIQRPSWTLLTRTVPATGLGVGSYTFQRNFSRGINLRVIDQDTGALLNSERFDTYDSQDDSRKLTQMLRLVPHGRIVALAVGDSAAKNLLDETKWTIQELLGSHYVHELKYRQAWALVSVVGGGNESCSEEVREHENHDTGGKALARRDFVTVDGMRFFVSAYSEWWNG